MAHRSARDPWLYPGRSRRYVRNLETYEVADFATAGSDTHLETYERGSMRGSGDSVHAVHDPLLDRDTEDYASGMDVEIW